MNESFGKMSFHKRHAFWRKLNVNVEFVIIGRVLNTMKWKRKAHEFDEAAVIYNEESLLSKKICIFGAGEIGQRISYVVRKFGILECFFDNDKKKQGTMYCGFPVIPLQQYLEKIKDDRLIVICAKDEWCREIEKQLDEDGKFPNGSYLPYKEYEKRLRIALFYERGILYLPLAQISLTERCTLQCKKCAHACNLVPSNREDLALMEAKKSADSLFMCVDYITEFVLIGGEPLLYRELPEIIDYIGGRYRNQIGIFSITTNGTILPKERLLDMCRKHDMLFRVSNYAGSIPNMGKKLEVFHDKAIQYGIPCVINGVEEVWTDYGFDVVDRGATEKELEDVFDACGTPCHEARGNRFYFCVMARSVAENMGKSIGMDDFFDMTTVNDEMGKRLFFEYTMGYSDKGCLDMCNYCRGAERVNYPIPAGEQMR